jgi:hypothetical protein
MSSNGMTIAVSTAASTDSYYKLTYMYRYGTPHCHVCCCGPLAMFADSECLQEALCRYAGDSSLEHLFMGWLLVIVTPNNSGCSAAGIAS